MSAAPTTVRRSGGQTHESRYRRTERLFHAWSTRPDCGAPDDGVEPRAATDVPPVTIPRLRGRGGPVVVVATPALRRALADRADVVALTPGGAPDEDLLAGARGLVVERAALTVGPWAGAERAHGTRLAHLLVDWAAAARAAGRPVVYVASAAPTEVNTRLVADEADVVVDAALCESVTEVADAAHALVTCVRVTTR